jgi:hypothetical protein
MQCSLGVGAQKLRAAPYGTSMSEPDDDYEWPPAAHPWRELITATLFFLLIGGFLIWMGWRLIDWLL